MKKNREIEKYELFECSCRSIEHICKVGYYIDLDDKNKWIDDFSIEQIFIKDEGFWARLINSFKYLFNYGNIWVNATLLKPKDVKRLIKIAEKYIEDEKNNPIL